MSTRLFPAFARAVVIASAVLACGCAAHSMTQAKRAADVQDYDVAIANYMKVLRGDPDNRDALQGLERAKLLGSDQHLLQGRRLLARGRTADAVLEFQIAAELNPANLDAEKELGKARDASRRTKRAIVGPDGARVAAGAGAHARAARRRAARRQAARRNRDRRGHDQPRALPDAGATREPQRHL